LKPWLKPLLINNNTAILLSETSNYTFQGEISKALLELLDGTHNEDDIAATLSHQFDLAEIYYHVLQLKNKGLIEAVPMQEPSASDIFHNRLGGEPAKLNSFRRIRVTSLGGIDPQPVVDRLSRQKFCQVEIAHWPSAELGADSLWIVLTPDYLEPELAEFNRKAQATGSHWLPFKPEGIEPWVGPLVIPGATPCMECLLHRLRGHHTHEMRLLRQNGEPPRLSQGISEASLDTTCGLLGVELEKFLSGSPNGFLDRSVVTINLQSLETRYHELIRRPHCSVCGNAVGRDLTSLPESEFRLTSQPKAVYTDCGERIKLAAETMKVFGKRISPVTGEVGALDVMENVPEFFGWAVRSSWATLDGQKADWSKGRIGATGASAGKGRSEIQARASALGEALERYCSQYFGYEPRLRAAFGDIRANAVHPLELNPFSDNQYENREVWAKRGDTGRVPERFIEERPIDWTPAWSLTNHQWKFIPSAHMYYNYPEEGGCFTYGDSNGVAAGNCVEEAIIQGLFELVERDSVALWWYNMLRRPALDLPTFGSSFVLEAAEGLRLRNHTLHVLDLTSDLGIPVFVAVGFGSHFDARIALDRAICEMGQSWIMYKNMSPNTIYREVTGRNLSTEQFLRPLEDASQIPLCSFVNHATSDFLTDVEKCVSILADQGLEMLVADLTRPEVGLSVVRVMVPGLVHFWPRFGAKRLYDIPVRLGWLDAPLPEENLNPVPFYA
jgi:ribosomal protein S12 methylthiotransferase accessory factor